MTEDKIIALKKPGKICGDPLTQLNPSYCCVVHLQFELTF